MKKILEQGIIITFPLNSQQEDKLLEEVRQKALAYFSKKERQNRLNSLVNSLKAIFKPKLEDIEDILPSEMSISLLFNKNNNKIGVYMNKNRTSQFGMNNNNYFNIESVDSFHI